jgi:tagaturonate reductase
VKSTEKGSTQAFDRQNHLYTLCVRGLEDGRRTEQFFLNNAISRVLSARHEWNAILACARQEEMEIVISNTTEIGIQLTEDDIGAQPPASFPGKLLAFLYARYQAFQGDPQRGMIIIPTELIVDNGTKLKEILTALAQNAGLPESFLQWLDTANTFCNSLVDRIVPGRLPDEESKDIERMLGYQDELMIAAEPYRLWAIEVPDRRTEKTLSFSAADPGVILTADITRYRELKLRLLNGTHTLSCALAFLNDYRTVGDAVESEAMGGFIRRLMLKEIAPILSGSLISEEEADRFAHTVLERFANPYIIHPWIDISLQYTAKIRMRIIPLLLAHYQQSDQAPSHMAAGLAAYMLFMRSTQLSDGSFQGNHQGKTYPVRDDHAGLLAAWWQKFPDGPAQAILRDTRLWDTDLSVLPGLTDAIDEWLQSGLQHRFPIPG